MSINNSPTSHSVAFLTNIFADVPEIDKNGGLRFVLV